MKVCVAPGAPRRFTSSLNERRRSSRVPALEAGAAGVARGEIRAHRLTDFLDGAQPVARPARKQLVPLRAARWLAAITAGFVHVLLVLLFAQRRYSWASSVVT